MSKFRYEGRNAQGTRVQGNLEASHSGAAARLLSQRQIIPLRITEEASGSDILEQINTWLSRKPPSTEDLILFCRQMHALTKAGVPIVRALTTLAGSSRSTTLREHLSDSVRQLQSGQDLTQALGQHPESFSPLFVNMIRVGENTGRLEESFIELARHLDRERDTRKRIQQATRYPTFVIIALIIALGIINFFVIPAFASVFAKLHAQLPLPTRILVASSHFMIHDGWLVALVCVAGFILLRRHIQTPLGRYQWDRFKLRIPLVGSIFERIMLSRFARSFAMMMRSGIPVIQALQVISRAVDNDYIGAAIRGMADQIERGDTITRTATATGMFSPLVLQMLMVGEESGTLEDMLTEVSTFYDEEVDYDLKQLTDRIEPLLLLGVGAIVLVLALGVFLPLWNLSSVMLHH
ncbi:MAG: type II secretion system F family protein [Pseudomonadales bacterium]|nr:type II secretion system F family protein [Pseudomonadales bacterium]